MTILPAALSPHSLASVPSDAFGGASFTFSVPRNLSAGSGLGRRGSGALGDPEDDGLRYESESELSEGASSRDASQHGPSGRLPGGGRPGGPAARQPPGQQ